MKITQEFTQEFYVFLIGFHHQELPYFLAQHNSSSDNLEKTDEFLERYIIYQNWSVKKKKRQSEQTDTNKETESVINNIPTNKSPRTDGFTGKFYKTLKEELMPILLILL